MKRFAMIVVAVTVLASGLQAQDAARLFKTAMNTEMVDGNLKAAIEQYKKVAEGPDRALAAQALLRMAECYQKLGDPQARAVFERVVREFSDQVEPAALARAKVGGAARAQAEITLRKVWTGGIQVAVSPDGRYMTHYNGMMNTGLIVRDLTTGVDRTLQTGSYVADSTFSRNGTEIAYGSCDGPTITTQSCELRVVSVNGTGTPGPRRVFTASEGVYVAPHDWSPDGKSIAVSVIREADRVLQLGVIGVSDGTLRVLKSAAWGGTFKGFFSPDGRDIAFNLRITEDDGKRDVYLMAVDASREVAAVTSPQDDFVLGWTPDGKHLLFGSNRSGTVGLWAQAFADRKAQGPPQLVKADIGSDVRSVGITRSGALYVAVRTVTQDIEVTSIDLATGKEIAAAARPIRSVAERDYQPTWSADGKSLGYVSVRRGENIVGIRSIATGVERELPLGAKLDAVVGLSWAPDARSFVAYGRDLRGRYGVFRIDASDGSVTPIAFREPPQVVGFCWSPDGKRMYYRSGQDGSIYERDLASDSERTLIPGVRIAGAPTVGPMTLSPDGRWIATSRSNSSTKSGALLLFPVAGGEARELLRVSLPQRFDPFSMVPQWTPDGRALLVTKQLGGNASEFWVVPIDGATPRKLEIDANRMSRDFRLHPDGRQLAYTVGEDRPEVWALENFLPLKPAQP